MNRLFVAYKPSGVGSNAFLGQLKRKYGVKKAGFSGTLDPFAKGVLLIGFGSYTKLFRFLNKTPKTYRATLWLGCHSPSLDTENIQKVETLPPFEQKEIEEAVASFHGEFSYIPPKFSAKKIDGKRAYELVRSGKEVDLKPVSATIYEIRLLHYMHPFVTFEATVSEGTYIRSLGEVIAKKLGVDGALSALERVREGQFVYEGEKALDIRTSLAIEENFYLGESENLRFGRKLALEDFKVQKPGNYFIDNGDFLSIVTIEKDQVKYELGRIELEC